MSQIKLINDYYYNDNRQFTTLIKFDDRMIERIQNWLNIYLFSCDYTNDLYLSHIYTFKHTYIHMSTISYNYSIAMVKRHIEYCKIFIERLIA